MGNKNLAMRLAGLVGALLVSACNPSPPPSSAASEGEAREFQGIWIATGTRQSIPFGTDRRASIANYSGTLMLSGAARPNAGFRADAIVLNDTRTSLVGRAVWTDERGDQAYSELRGEGASSSDRIVGTFVGGTGRYAGATGTYEFKWRFLLEGEEGTVQGQSEGLKGRVSFNRESSQPGTAKP